jgi:hypothetical protein
MRSLILASFLVVGLAGVSYAQPSQIDRLYDRIEQLERENLRLKEENERLRQQRSGYGRYGSRNNSQLYDTNRRLTEANRTKRLVEDFLRW